MKSITIKIELDDKYWSDEDYAEDESGELLLDDLYENNFICGVTKMSVVSIETSRKKGGNNEND